jgi:hypothetical protein
VFTIGIVAAPGFGHVASFVLAVLCGLYDWRIWIKRATRLTRTAVPERPASRTEPPAVRVAGRDRPGLIEGGS